MTSVRRVPVALPDRPYDVVVGSGVSAEAVMLLEGRRRVAVVTHPALAEEHAASVMLPLRAAGVGCELALMEEGEAAKSLATIEQLCRTFTVQGLLRGDAVVAVGGGVVGDTAGFAAAVYHRGVDVVQVPTTLLAQVDAAIGGKTAVNLPEGKNLVGAFHQPIGVLADVDELSTLPDRQYRSGLGEVAKYALIEPALLHTHAIADLVERSAATVLARDPEVLTELVTGCAAVKAHVVAADPFERSGVRAALNYGHTLAHALETVGGYDLLHGEAVGVGLVFAGRMAGALERIDPEAVERHEALVASLGLPTKVLEPVRADDLLAVMARDKKARGGLTFVLLGERGLEPVEDPPATVLEQGLGAVGVKA